MAEAGAQPEEGGAAPGAAPKRKVHQDVETQNLEKVTDYVEEAGNSEELGKVCGILLFLQIHSLQLCASRPCLSWKAI